ncbi:tyrosine N-monooxygenase-like [Rhodamnia argentea]|uniref:Tyrosine N-monooxygenase-like n=1 Tax=Rhodamnia argentea TaxID=178133 RepID=A0A8B8N5I8_9MYRT|nr:tyrosine N-monooxygenase-like [Rhodamnia argentea]
MISSSSIPLLFIVLILLLILIKKLKFRSTRENGKSVPQLPPGPAPWPTIGCVPEMLCQKPIFWWIHCLMKEMDTDIACVRLGKVHVIPVTCPKIAQEFLKKHDAIFSSRPTSMATRMYSGGYVTAGLTPYGSQSNKMRRVLVSEIISPARHHRLVDRRTEEADNLVKYIYNRSKSSSRTVNVRTATRQYTGNVMRKIMFSKRWFGEERADGGPTVAEEEHVEAIFTIIKYLYAFCISDYFPWLVGLDLDGHERSVKEAVRTVNKYHDPIIDSRLGKWRRFGNSDDESTSDEPHDLLDVLVKLKDSEGKPLLTPEEIKAEVTEIMFASVDNPSNAVEWALAEMMNQPEILKTAMEELDRVVGTERLVQECDIPHLNYIKACAREAFRLHPIAPFVPTHMAMSDAIVAGYFIPKGSHVLLSRLGLGRNPKVWNEPLEFRPQRHLTSDCTEVQLTEPDLRFISFSTGRRGCVAPMLGTAMTTMLLARMVQGFNWKAPPEVTSINLDESTGDLFLANPLIAHAEPRLPLHLYP